MSRLMMTIVVLGFLASPAWGKVAFKVQKNHTGHLGRKATVTERLRSRWRQIRNRTKYRYAPSVARMAGRLGRSVRRTFLWHKRKGPSTGMKGMKRRSRQPGPRLGWQARARHRPAPGRHHARLIGRVQTEILKYQSGHKKIDARYYRLLRILHRLQLRQQQAKATEKQQSRVAKWFKKMLTRAKGKYGQPRGIDRKRDYSPRDFSPTRTDRRQFRIFRGTERRGGLRRLWSIMAGGMKIKRQPPPQMVRPILERSAPPTQYMPLAGM